MAGSRSRLTEVYLLPEHGGHAKVGDLDVVVLVQEQILRLQVPVGNSPGVQVVHSGEQLVEVSLRFRDGHSDVGLWKGKRED